MTTLFDLDSFSAEVRGQDEQISDMLGGAEEIRNLMNARRGIMHQQQRADEIKSKLCDKLREEKIKVPGLDKRIRALEVNDPELFDYIRKLEFVQDGIWCTKCNAIKNIGGRPRAEENTQNESVITETHDMVQLQKEYRELENNFGILLNHLAEIRNEYQVKIQQSVEIAAQLENQLKQMCRDAYKLGLAIGAETHDSESEAVAPQTSVVVPTINATIKKEDLPSKPAFDLDQLLNEKISAMSADNLLDD